MSAALMRRSAAWKRLVSGHGARWACRSICILVIVFFALHQCSSLTLYVVFVGALELRSLSSPFTQMTPLGHLACLLALPIRVTKIILLSTAYGILPAGLWAAALLVSDRASVYECQRESFHNC